MRIRISPTFRLRTLMILIAFSAVTLAVGPFLWDSHSAEYRRGFAQGRNEADQQILAGPVSIYTFGLPSYGTNLDMATGLPYESIGGCLIGDFEKGRAEGHNERVQEHLVGGSTPVNSHQSWTDDLNDLIRSYTKQAQLHPPVRLAADGPSVVSPDGRFRVSLYRSETAPSDPEAPQPCDLVIVQPDGSRKSTYAFGGNVENQLVWGPRGSHFAIVQTCTSEKYKVVQALDLRLGCWLNTPNCGDAYSGVGHRMESLISASDF